MICIYKTIVTIMVATFLSACVTTQTVENGADLHAEFGVREIAVVVFPEPESHVVRPGDRPSMPWRYSKRRPRSTIEAGGDNVMRLITDRDIEGGAYFDRQERTDPHEQALDRDARERLWMLSEELTRQ